MKLFQNVCALTSLVVETGNVVLRSDVTEELLLMMDIG